MWFHSTPWFSPEDSNLALVDLDFNMWSRRLAPFHDIQTGSTYITVSDGGREKGRVMSLVYVTDHIAAEYTSHQHAWDVVEAAIPVESRAQLNWDRDRFLNHPYTRSHPRSGYILATLTEPLINFNTPRPAELTFRPNGWAWMDDADLGDWYARGRDIAETELLCS